MKLFKRKRERSLPIQHIKGGKTRQKALFKIGTIR